MSKPSLRAPSGVWAIPAAYFRWATALNNKVGLFAMYLFFGMMAIATYGVISNVILKSPAIWAMEMAQFTMAAYYLLGGGYTLRDEAHVRMDVLYERWGPRAKAVVDSITGLALIGYLCVLLWGGILSTQYALEYNQKNFTAWGPPLAPVKIIMSIGIVLMLLQAVALWLKDLAATFGVDLEPATERAA